MTKYKINDLVAVSLLNKNVQFGRVVGVTNKSAMVNVAGNVVTADIGHITKVHDKNLIRKLTRHERQN